MASHVLNVRLDSDLVQVVVVDDVTTHAIDGALALAITRLGANPPRVIPAYDDGGAYAH